MIIDRADGDVRLFNLEDDAGETRNLASEEPSVVEELRSLLESVEFFIGEGKPAAGMTEEEIKRDEFQIERVRAHRWCTSLRAKYREYVGEDLEKSFHL